MRSEIEVMAKSKFYRYLVNSHCLHSISQNLFHVKSGKLSQSLEFLDITLIIEKGRYENIERNDRKCTLCNMNEIEDEYHFILQETIH